MLKTVDLFTGIGGFVVALSDIATPTAYCDNNKAVGKTLAKLMQRKQLPRAPVVEDVKDVASIKSACGKHKIDMVTAGFPCPGFSAAGKRRGILDERSALFHDAAKVVAALKPGMVFFENVSNILMHASDMSTIARTMVDLGYSMSWTVVAASDVGCPQLRRRWFCLCVRHNFKRPALTLKRGRIRTWSSKSMPPPVSVHNSSWSPRLGMLGNSIVPDSARLAFARLYSGFDVMHFTGLSFPHTLHPSTKSQAIGDDARTGTIGALAHARDLVQSGSTSRRRGASD